MSDEATTRLAKLRARFDVDVQAQHDASVEVLRELAKVSLDAGFPGSLDASKGIITLKFSFATIKVGIDPSTGCVVTDSSGTVRTVPLDFNPIAKRWESREYDRSIVPTPGQPRPRKSAVRAVVDHVEELVGRR